MLGQLIRGSNIIPVIIYAAYNYGRENQRVLRTDTELETGDVIKINHSMNTLYGEDKRSD